MCGIAGFIDFSSQTSRDDLAGMAKTLEHRGPDDSGFYFHRDETYRIGLCHTRLAIIDLSSGGHQPMEYDGFVIVFNGEVYNYGEIRERLEESGYSFQSQSDTEVVLKAFHKWGHDSLEMFRGMWAFAIFERKKNQLFLCRDRVGVKPLYYYQDHNGLIFASELKAILAHRHFKKEVDGIGVELFFRYGFIPAPHSIFKNTKKLLPGHHLTIDGSNRQLVTQRYWCLPVKHSDAIQQGTSDDSCYVNELEKILQESFSLRLISDAPLGIFLSGGVDSSLVTAILQQSHHSQLNTFTIGFHEKKFNEAHWAKKVATHLGTKHKELYCTAKDAFELVAKLPDYFDEPFGDSSAIPTLLVSQLAARDVKVVLSADGGDELFGGYPWHIYFPQLVAGIPGSSLQKRLTQMGLQTLMSVSRLLARSGLIRPPLLSQKNDLYGTKMSKASEIYGQQNSLAMYDVFHSLLFSDQLKSLGLTKNIRRSDFLDNTLFSGDIVADCMAFDFQSYLVDDILTKTDRMTMAVSIEGREPFLDPKIFEFSSNLPQNMKFRNGEGKYILRQLLKRYLPHELVDRPKQGFNIPVNEWFGSDLKALVFGYLQEERIRKEGILNPMAVTRIVKEYTDKKTLNHQPIWLLLMFQMWTEKYLN